MYEWESFQGGPPSIAKLNEERGPPARRDTKYFTEINENYSNGNLKFDYLGYEKSVDNFKG